jgi:hypothetical protein
MLALFMALLSFVESAPRAYRLKASNAAPSSSTSTGAIPSAIGRRAIQDASRPREARSLGDSNPCFRRERRQAAQPLRNNLQPASVLLPRWVENLVDMGTPAIECLLSLGQKLVTLVDSCNP